MCVLGNSRLVPSNFKRLFCEKQARKELTHRGCDIKQVLIEASFFLTVQIGSISVGNRT